MKFHTFSHYIFAPGFMFTLHLLYLFAHHHKVHKANLWLSNLPSHAPRNLSNPSCSAPACACWPVLSNMPAAGCWGGHMHGPLERKLSRTEMAKGPKFLSWNYEAMAHLPSTSPSSSSRRSSSSLCMSRISSWRAKQSLPQMVRFNPMGTRLMLIFQCS